MKLLVAYDGSPGSNAALADLRRAGLPEIAEARVLSIAEVFLPPTAASPQHTDPVREDDPRLRAVHQASRLAEEAKQKVASMFPKWSVEALVRADSPAWGIVKESDSWQPDLVVVGSEGHSRISRILLGSVSHKVLTECRSTVRVARAGVRSSGTIRLIVGVDGSSGSDAAVQTVKDRTWPSGTELRLMAVLDSRMATGLLPGPFTGEPGPDPALEDQEAWIRDILEKAESRFRGIDLAVDSLLEIGDPKELLVEHAKNWGADCIFVGARGLTGMDRFLLGSVSASVAMRAPCSVEIVHGAAFD